MNKRKRLLRTIRTFIYGFLCVGCIWASTKGLLTKNVCLLIGIPSGIMFFREAREDY